MNFLITLLMILAFATAALATEAVPKVKTAKDAAMKDDSPEMRHGWTVFTGPKRTTLGVNDADSINRGKTAYLKHCSSCHGESGAGDGPQAKQKGIKPANLKALGKEFPNYYLVVQVQKGSGDMPKWEDLLTNQEVWDLSNYIQTLNNKN